MPELEGAPMTFNGPGSGADLGADAKSSIAAALERSIIQFDEDAIREIMFYYEYCGEEWTTNHLNRLMVLKYHQAPWVQRVLIDALKALSLHDFVNRFQNAMQLGGGGK